jgi:hypothetical protein
MKLTNEEREKYAKTYPLDTFSGTTTQEILDLVDMILEERREEIRKEIDIAINEYAHNPEREIGLGIARGIVRKVELSIIKQGK